MADTLPKISGSVTAVDPSMALKVYSGDVPKSPNTMPNAISIPAEEIFFMSMSFMPLYPVG